MRKKLFVNLFDCCFLQFYSAPHLQPLADSHKSQQLVPAEGDPADMLFSCSTKTKIQAVHVLVGSQRPPESTNVVCTLGREPENKGKAGLQLRKLTRLKRARHVLNQYKWMWMGKGLINKCFPKQICQIKCGHLKKRI